MIVNARRQIQPGQVGAPLKKHFGPSSAHITFSVQEIRTFKRVHRWLMEQGIHAMRRKPAHLHKTDDALVIDLVSQMAVIGNSEPGKKVRTDPEIVDLLRWRGHLEAMNRADRARAIHRALKLGGARYAGKSLKTCRYSKRLADSLAIMADAGGPLAWVKEVARVRTEAERVEKLRDLPVFRGQKSPRDFLSTKLGLAKNLVALDIRIMQVLRTIAPTKIQGTTTPGKTMYEAIEKALVEQVAVALGCTGYELDQLLYLGNKDGAIVTYLCGAARDKRVPFPRKAPQRCT